MLNPLPQHKAEHQRGPSPRFWRTRRASRLKIARIGPTPAACPKTGHPDREMARVAPQPKCSPALQPAPQDQLPGHGCSLCAARTYTGWRKTQAAGPHSTRGPRQRDMRTRVHRHPERASFGRGPSLTSAQVRGRPSSPIASLRADLQAGAGNRRQVPKSEFQ